MTISLVDRTYLFDAIDRDALPRLTVITAPSGSGKTILAQQFMALLPVHAVWHTLDIWQRDAHQLHTASRQHWQAYNPDLAIAEHGENALACARLLAGSLSKYCLEPVYYILDDIHNLKDSIDATIWLQTLLTTCPPNVYFIWIGQDVPVIEWYREIGRSRVFSLNIEQLKLTVADAMQMADISLADAQELVSRFNGLVAPVRLALDPVSRRAARHLLASEAPGDALFQKLASTYFDRQPLDIQHQLLVASTTETISLALYQSQFDVPSLDQLLARLHKDHLLLTREGVGYRFHSLFRAYLQGRFYQQQQELYQHCHLKAAQWYEQGDDVRAAIVHYLEAGEKVLAVRLAEDVANELLIRGYHQTLLALNDLLDGIAAPRLRLVASVLLVNMNETDASNILLDRAEAGFLERGDTQRLESVQLQRAFNYQRSGDYQRAITDARSILEKTPVPLRQAWAWRIVGCSHTGKGDYKQGIAALQTAYSIFLEQGTMSDQSQTLQDLSEAYIRGGYFAEGVAMLQQVIALAREGDNRNMLAFALNNLGSAFHYTSHYEDAITSLESARRALTDTDTRAASYIYHSLGDYYRDIGQAGAAQHAYDVAGEILHGADLTLVRRIAISRCRMALWHNQLYEARQILDAVPLEDFPDGLDAHVISFWKALLSIWAGDGDGLDRRLHEHASYLLDHFAVRSLGKLAGTLGFVAIQTGSRELEVLFETVATHIPGSFVQPLSADCYYWSRLCDFVQTSPALWDRVRQPYNALENHTTRPASSNSDRARTLEVYMLGQDQIVVGGIALPDSQWASPQARLFFYCLLLHGPQDKAQLERRLWDRRSKHQARNALREVRQRLKEIHLELVVVENNVYQLNLEWLVTTDMDQFEDSLQRARQLPKHDARTETLYLRALSIYEANGTGGLLPALYTDWLEPYRLWLERLYIEALKGVASCAVTRNDYAFAVRHYEKCLVMDIYDEDVYRQIMQCYAASNQQAQVQLTYNRLEQLLVDELDVAPHPETCALLDQLLV